MFFVFSSSFLSVVQVDKSAGPSPFPSISISVRTFSHTVQVASRPRLPHLLRKHPLLSVSVLYRVSVGGFTLTLTDRPLHPSLTVESGVCSRRCSFEENFP